VLHKHAESKDCIIAFAFNVLQILHAVQRRLYSENILRQLGMGQGAFEIVESTAF
jgi:hypothetical protein